MAMDLWVLGMLLRIQKAETKCTEVQVQSVTVCSYVGSTEMQFEQTRKNGRMGSNCSLQMP